MLMSNGQTLEMSEFARGRHTPDSPWSHFGGTEEQLLQRVSVWFDRAKIGYRTDGGVLEVSVPCQEFYTSVCTLQEGDELRGKYTARKEGETPRKGVGVVGGQKMAAKSCAIILYRGDVLAETNERSTTADWEVISINASPTLEATPIMPMTLLHNHFGSDGGTATGMTDGELVTLLRTSMEYWKDKALCYAPPRK